ncbi:T5orf172 domain-containing protein [Aspergillus granulosus]|uniref:T5orf172 domain-containing protein n=1 Tax=Aspergillus granulosus TaxID=176169 RepID=A0ABR4HIU2_9EURO
MAKRTDSVPDQDIPQILDQPSTPVRFIEDLPTSEENTPLSSPTDERDSVFSPNASVFTDITDDYGWDSPSKQQRIQVTPRSPSPSSLATEDGGNFLTQFGVLDAASGYVSRENISDILDTPAELSTTGPCAPSETTDATNAVVIKNDRNDDSPGLMRIWDQCLVSGRHGSIDAHDENQSRRISFSLEINMNFSNRRQSLRGLPRPRNNTHPESGELPRHIESQLMTPRNSFSNFGPTIEVTVPDSPADKTPYIKSVKSQCGQVMISLARILPMSTQQFLVQDQKHCVAIKKGTNTRCGSRRNLNAQAITDALNTLTISNIAGIGPVLQNLITLTLCGSHQTEAKKSLAAWFGDEPRNQISDHLAEIGEWINALKRSASGRERPLGTPNTRSTDSPAEGIQPVSSSDPPGLTISASSNVPSASLIQNFEPYLPKCHKGKSVHQRLREVLSAPLTDLEIKKSGLIYIFWYQGNFGHLKIGYTEDLDQRLRAWEKCGKPLDVHFPVDGDDKRPVQHVYRVEKLIHAELKDFRLAEKCPGCNKTHNEWFRVSKDVAVNIVRKWMQWMREQPYVSRTMDDGETEWRLDNEERVGKISELCTPSTAPENPPTPSKKPHHPNSRLRLSTPKYSQRKRRAASASF